MCGAARKGAQERDCTSFRPRRSPSAGTGVRAGPGRGRRAGRSGAHRRRRAHRPARGALPARARPSSLGGRDRSASSCRTRSFVARSRRSMRIDGSISRSTTCAHARSKRIRRLHCVGTAAGRTGSSWRASRMPAAPWTGSWRRSRRSCCGRSQPRYEVGLRDTIVTPHGGNDALPDGTGRDDTGRFHVVTGVPRHLGTSVRHAVGPTRRRRPSPTPETRTGAQARVDVSWISCSAAWAGMVVQATEASAGFAPSWLRARLRSAGVRSGSASRSAW